MLWHSLTIRVICYDGFEVRFVTNFTMHSASRAIVQASSARSTASLRPITIASTSDCSGSMDLACAAVKNKTQPFESPSTAAEQARLWPTLSSTLISITFQPSADQVCSADTPFLFTCALYQTPSVCDKGAAMALTVSVKSGFLSKTRLQWHFHISHDKLDSIMKISPSLRLIFNQCSMTNLISFHIEKKWH